MDVVTNICLLLTTTLLSTISSHLIFVNVQILSVFGASTYLRHFSSDRSHMFNSKTKTWNAPPPPYKRILLAKNNQEPNSERPQNTLKQYMVISDQNVVDSQKQNNEDNASGQIYSLSQLLQRFNGSII